MANRTLRRFLLGAVLFAGCYSPTLPLPPPVKPEISMTETGAYHLAGGVLPNAQVSALNERNYIIDGQQADHVGAYSFDLKEGQPGDEIELWYRYANDLSSATVFTLPDLSAKSGAGGVPSGSGGGGVGGAP
ncbi:MAG TPA: hypothetical protein VFV94_00490 [Polyangiaceae bacterium]|jgi:hypothetical protein|nr:hypothetical protein [Polyangiaceae bacterium]